MKNVSTKESFFIKKYEWQFRKIKREKELTQFNNSQINAKYMSYILDTRSVIAPVAITKTLIIIFYEKERSKNFIFFIFSHGTIV